MHLALVGRRGILAALAAVTFTWSATALAAPGIPVRVRVLRGARQGPASVDPRLDDLKGQLSRLAYQRWELAREQQSDMAIGQKVTVSIPDGSSLELTLAESTRDTVTFLLRVGGTQSRMTISKDQRIVHQLGGEKDGAAWFASIKPW
jgi:hypothetical protein